MSLLSSYKIGISHPNEFVYSESFIRQQVQSLHGVVFEFYGGWKPTLWGRPSQPIFTPQPHKRVVRGLRKTFLGHTQEQILDDYLFDFFVKNKLDVMLANYGPTACALLPILKKAKIPLVVHFHGFDIWETLEVQKYHSQYREVFAYASACIVGCKDMVPQLQSLNCPLEKIQLAPCGIDIQFFMPGSPFPRPPQIVNVGRMVEKKAPFYTLLAFSEVCKHVPDARLVMAGDGELLPATQELAKSLKIEKSVTFLKGIPIEQVRGLLQTSMLYVQHSIHASTGDAEGTGISVLEASACGLPVVATRHCGFKESVIEGETGFLVDEGDYRGMAEKMLLIIRDSKIQSEMGKKGRQRMEAEYSHVKTIGRLEEILVKAIQNRM